MKTAPGETGFGLPHPGETGFGLPHPRNPRRPRSELPRRTGTPRRPGRGPPGAQCPEALRYRLPTLRLPAGDDAQPAGPLPTRVRRAPILRMSGPRAGGRPYECPSSAESSSGTLGTEPESRAGRSGKGSTRVSSITGGAGCGGFGITAASECPPHP